MGHVLNVGVLSSCRKGVCTVGHVGTRSADMNIEFKKEVLSVPDMSPAYRAVDVRIWVDERLTLEEQLHGAFYEIVSCHFDPHEDRREMCLEVAGHLLDAYIALRE
jgi:hypothetical protein